MPPLKLLRSTKKLADGIKKFTDPKVKNLMDALHEDHEYTRKILMEHVEPELRNMNESGTELWYGKHARVREPRSFIQKTRHDEEQVFDGACQMHDGEIEINAENTVRVYVNGAPDSRVPGFDPDNLDKGCEGVCAEFATDDWIEFKETSVGLYDTLLNESEHGGVWFTNGQYESNGEEIPAKGRVCLHKAMLETKDCMPPNPQRKCVGYSTYQTNGPKTWCMLYFSKDPLVGVLKEDVTPGNARVISNGGKIKCMEVLSLDPEVAKLQELATKDPAKFNEKAVTALQANPDMLAVSQSMEQPNQQLTESQGASDGQ